MRSTVCAICCIVFQALSLSAQVGFRNDLSIESGEPNTAYHIEEHNDHFFISGQYFDSTIPSWTSYIAVYNRGGEFMSHHLLSNDTLPILNLSHNVHIYEETYNVLSVFGGIAKIVTYDFELDSFYTNKAFPLSDLGVRPWSMYPDFETETYYFGGHSDDSLKVVKISPLDTITYVDGDLFRQRVGLNLKVNSKGQVVIIGRDKLKGRESHLDTVYVSVLDSNLSLIKSNLNLSSNPNISLNKSKGFVIDKEDNIVISGNQLEIADTPDPRTCRGQSSLDKATWSECQ